MSDSVYNSRYQKPQVNSQVDPSQSNYYQPNSQNNGIEGQNYDDMMQGNDPQGPSSDLTAGQQILVDKLHSTEEAMASKLQSLENKYDSIRNSGASPDQVLAEINELNSLVNELEGSESLYEKLQNTLNQAGVDTVGFDIEQQIDSFEDAIKGLENEAKKLKQKEINDQKEAEAEKAKEEADQKAAEAAEEKAEAAEEKMEAAEVNAKIDTLFDSLNGKNGWFFAGTLKKNGKRIEKHYPETTSEVQNALQALKSSVSTGNWSHFASAIHAFNGQDQNNTRIGLLFEVLKQEPSIFEAMPVETLKLLQSNVTSNGGNLGVVYLRPGPKPPKKGKKRDGLEDKRVTGASVYAQLSTMIQAREAEQLAAEAEAAKDAAKG